MRGQRPRCRSWTAFSRKCTPTARGFASAVSLAAAEVGDPGGERGIMDVDVEDGGVVNVPERGVDVLDLLRERIEIVRVAHGDRLARRDRQRERHVASELEQKGKRTVTLKRWMP